MKVKIGPYTYKIKFVKQPADFVDLGTLPEEGDLDGFCDNTNFMIYIKKAQTKMALKETLLHELIHAIWYVSGMCRFEGETSEEMYVSVFAPYLTTVLIQHPKVMEYLND